MKKILIIDDYFELADIVAHFLRRNGCDVHMVCDSRLAVSKALELMPDLIICDFEMPGITGDEIVKTLRSVHNYSGCILAFTSREPDKMLAAGCDGALPKSVSPSTLFERIEKFITIRL